MDEDQQQPQAPVSAEQVYATLQSTLSLTTATRGAAEAQLRAWEKDAAPGFISSLVKVISEVNGVPEELRLLAAVVAKNAVGSSWRKVIATREWSRVPDEEKEYVRSALTAVLFQDPSARVALQTTLLLTNVARFDVPRPWEALLPTLAAAAAPGSAAGHVGRLRALKALKFVLAALQDKQFVFRPQPGMMVGDMLTVQDSIDSERQLLFQQAKALLGPLRQQWEQSAAALLNRGQDWEAQGALSALYLSALRELLQLLPDWEGVEADMEAFLRDGAQAAAACVAVLFTGPPGAAAAAGEEPFRDLVGKTWERLLQCALTELSRTPLRFAKFVPAWVTLCINTALLGMDASTIHHVRAKSRVLLTRFVAQVLLSPYYRPDAFQGSPAALLSSLGLLRPSVGEQMRAAQPDLQAASDCLDAILSEQDGRCAALVQALVSKYIVLSPEELAEWEADPEGFARQVDVETSPDADTPRPCGVALLECMLERAKGPVAAALLAMAAQLQAQPLTPDSILLREATYRAVGEVFPHLREQVDFGGWYDSELRHMLQSAELTGLYGDVLRARALWLVGVCGGELQQGTWAEALSLCVKHIQAPDFVVSLLAVSATTASLGHVLEEQQFVKRPEREKRLILEGPLQDDEDEEDVTAQCTAEYNAHVAAVEANLDALIVGCFSLLPRLAEVESMVRVLQCVSVAVELMGDRVRPHLATITTALPQVWTAISQRSGDNTGALARLHSALISTVTHLISRLGVAAMQDQHVSAILLPLLHHATNLGSSESEPLIEDGLRLWLVVLRCSDRLYPQLQELLLSKLPPIIRRGQDNAAVYGIVEGYVLHGGVDAVAPVLQLVVQATVGSLTSVMSHAASQLASPQPQLALITPDLASEAGAALSLLSVLQRLYDAAGAAPPPEVQGGVAAAAALAAYDFGGGSMRLPGKAVGVVEACFEVATRALFRDTHALGAVLGAGAETQHRFLDRWITLSSARELGELFVPALAALGRSRRHDAVVGICSLIVGDGCEGMRDLPRATNALVLGLKSLREAELYRGDQERLATLQPADPNHEDQLLLRRLLLLRADPMRGVDVGEALRAAAAKVITQHGQEAVLRALEGVDPLYREQFEEAMHLAPPAAQQAPAPLEQ